LVCLRRRGRGGVRQGVRARPRRRRLEAGGQLLSEWDEPQLAEDNKPGFRRDVTCLRDGAAPQATEDRPFIPGSAVKHRRRSFPEQPAIGTNCLCTLSVDAGYTSNRSVAFGCELQGFVAAQTARGYWIRTVTLKIAELC
jgi:hypothetical protein